MSNIPISPLPPTQARHYHRTCIWQFTLTEGGSTLFWPLVVLLFSSTLEAGCGRRQWVSGSICPVIRPQLPGGNGSAVIWVQTSWPAHCYLLATTTLILTNSCLCACEYVCLYFSQIMMDQLDPTIQTQKHKNIHDGTWRLWTENSHIQANTQSDPSVLWAHTRNSVFICYKLFFSSILCL